MVGRFIVRGNVAAVDFNQDLIEATRGITAKQLNVGNLFSNSNAVLNLNIALNEQARQSYTSTIEVKNEAQSWLKDNLNIDLD